MNPIIVTRAKEIAIKVHGNQTDKLGIPYFTHLTGLYHS